MMVMAVKSRDCWGPSGAIKGPSRDCWGLLGPVVVGVSGRAHPKVPILAHTWC